MKKINPKQQNTFLHSAAAAVALTLILFLSTNVQKAQCLSTPAAAEWGCNATRIADCLADDEEFQMESETSRRFLIGGRGKTITIPAQNPKKPFCDRDSYGSCIGRPNKFFNKRPCDYKNTCGRDA